jgi:cysteinyl-tRNA synthetase
MEADRNNTEKIRTNKSDAFINRLIEVRAEVRKQKLWTLSDQIRDKLKELNVTIEDSKDGTTWRYS